MISKQIALALAGFGIAGLIGNTAAASIADRAPLRATVLAISALALAAVGISLTGQPFVRIALLVVWGMGHTAAVALCQVRVTLAGRSAPAFAMAMNISAANLGIALGALVGGWVVEAWGVNAIGWGATGLALVAIALAAGVARRSGSQDIADFGGVGAPPWTKVTTTPWTADRLNLASSAVSHGLGRLRRQLNKPRGPPGHARRSRSRNRR